MAQPGLLATLDEVQAQLGRQRGRPGRRLEGQRQGQAPAGDVVEELLGVVVEAGELLRGEHADGELRRLHRALHEHQVEFELHHAAVGAHDGDPEQRRADADGDHHELGGEGEHVGALLGGGGEQQRRCRSPTSAMRICTVSRSVTMASSRRRHGEGGRGDDGARLRPPDAVEVEPDDGDAADQGGREEPVRHPHAPGRARWPPSIATMTSEQAPGDDGVARMLHPRELREEQPSRNSVMRAAPSAWCRWSGGGRRGRAGSPAWC